MIGRNHLAPCNCTSSVTHACFDDLLPDRVRHAPDSFQSQDLDESLVDPLDRWCEDSQLERNVLQRIESFGPTVVAYKDNWSHEGWKLGLVLLLVRQCFSFPLGLFLFTLVLVHLIILLIFIEASLQAFKSVCFTNTSLQELSDELYSMILI